MMETELLQENIDPQKHNSVNKFGKILCLILSLGILSIVPAIAFSQTQEDDITTDKAIYISAASFAIVANLLSAGNIFLHITHWYKPKIQKYAIPVIFMPAIWATGSFLSLRFYDYGEYIVFALDIYEALVLVCILFMFLSILGGADKPFKEREKAVMELLKTKDASLGVHKKCCVICFSTWQMGEHFYYEVKWGVLQVIILKIVYVTTALIFNELGYYDADSMGWTNANTYVLIGGIVSMVWSMHSLKMFYWALRYELKNPIDWHPGWKIVCFKGILIISMIQGKILSIFVSFGVITGGPNWDVTHITLVFQNFMVCIEMVFLSAFNYTVFPYSECLPSADSRLTV